MRRRQFIKFLSAGAVVASIPITAFGRHIPKNKLDCNKLFKGPYYLYEVVGQKVGVTIDPTTRKKNRKDYSNFKILGTYDCIYEVSNEELRLQEKKGYRLDHDPYFVTRLKGRAAIKTRGNIESWVNSRGIQHKCNSKPIKVYKILEGEGKYNNNQKFITIFDKKETFKKYKYFSFTKIKKKKYITTFNSIHQVSRKLDLKPSGISQVLSKSFKKSNYYQYTFEYA